MMVMMMLMLMTVCTAPHAGPLSALPPLLGGLWAAFEAFLGSLSADEMMKMKLLMLMTECAAPQAGPLPELCWAGWVLFLLCFLVFWLGRQGADDAMMRLCAFALPGPFPFKFGNVFWEGMC